MPLAHFSRLAQGQLRVFLDCDRYSAYKKLAKETPNIVLAHCWVHQRRDFPEAANQWPELKDWMHEWVDDIGGLYALNKSRLTHWEEGRPLGRQSAAFRRHHRALRAGLSRIKARREACQEDLHAAQRSVLASLGNHWSGLTVFAKQPQVPMDNNAAERSLRNAVTGHKRYYGSGAVWSAELAALLFMVLFVGVDPRHWLTACADNGGRAPADLSAFLPWRMGEERRQAEPRPAVRGHRMTSIGAPPTGKRYCGRDFSAGELAAIRALIADNLSCTRAVLSRLACEALGWRKADGGLKEMSCSVAMLRMQDDGLIRLPTTRRKRPQSRIEFTERTAPQTPVTRPVQQLAPLQFCPVASQAHSRMWNEYVHRYLGYKTLPGTRLRYFVTDGGHILALLRFGASAW